MAHGVRRPSRSLNRTFDARVIRRPISICPGPGAKGHFPARPSLWIEKGQADEQKTKTLSGAGPASGQQGRFYQGVDRCGPGCNGQPKRSDTWNQDPERQGCRTGRETPREFRHDRFMDCRPFYQHLGGRGSHGHRFDQVCPDARGHQCAALRHCAVVCRNDTGQDIVRFEQDERGRADDGHAKAATPTYAIQPGPRDQSERPSCPPGGGCGGSGLPWFQRRGNNRGGGALRSHECSFPSGGIPDRLPRCHHPVRRGGGARTEHGNARTHVVCGNGVRVRHRAGIRGWR